MEAYEKKFGRSPASLKELATFDASLKISELTPFHVTVSPERPQRLFVRVNQRYSFVIDDRHQPSWVQFSALSPPPP